MRQGLLLAVGALSTLAQGAVVENREEKLQDRQIVNIEGNGAVEVTTVKAENIQGLTGGNSNGILAGILDALNGGNRQNSGGHRNKGNKNNNCPAPPPPLPPMTVTKTVFQNASVPAPLTVFVTQAAPPPLTVIMTQSCPPPPPAAPAPPPAAPPAAPPVAVPPPAATPPTPPPVAAEPPAAAPAPPAAQPPQAPAASAPAALPFVGNPANGNNPTTSLNLGGLNGGSKPNPAGGAAAIPAVTAPPVANNPAAQPNAAVSGLNLSKSLVLGNLLQQTIGLQARQKPEAQVHAEVMPADWQEEDDA